MLNNGLKELLGALLNVVSQSEMIRYKDGNLVRLAATF